MPSARLRLSDLLDLDVIGQWVCSLPWAGVLVSEQNQNFITDFIARATKIAWSMGNGFVTSKGHDLVSLPAWVMPKLGLMVRTAERLRPPGNGSYFLEQHIIIMCLAMRPDDRRKSVAFLMEHHEQFSGLMIQGLFFRRQLSQSHDHFACWDLAKSTVHGMERGGRALKNGSDVARLKG